MVAPDGSSHLEWTATLLRLLAVWVLIAAPAFGQHSSTAAIVGQFYPASLTAFPDEFGGREQCFAVYDAEPSGAPRTIVAAYTNHTEAAIRVLRRGDAGFAVVAEPDSGLDLSGVRCEISLEDADGDGRKEVRVDFSVNRDTVSWLFRWDGKRLSNLTPTTSTAATGYQASGFVNGSLVDVDNDRVKEVYVQPEYPRFPGEPVLPARLYRLSGGHYVPAGRLVGAWELVQETAAPYIATISFTTPQGADGPYTVRLVSGLPDGSARPTSGRVSMNGREIVAPESFGADLATIERRVALASDNQLQVRIAGKPGSRVLIVIESERWGAR